MVFLVNIFRILKSITLWPYYKFIYAARFVVSILYKIFIKNKFTPWSISSFPEKHLSHLGVNYTKKKLHFINGKIDISTLTENYTCPVYIYNSKQIKDNIDGFKEAIKTIKGISSYNIAYAVKSNPNPEIMDLVNEKGIGADVVSIEELKLAINHGIKGSNITFSGVGKTFNDLVYVVKKANKVTINVESINELKEIKHICHKLKKSLNICLRFNPHTSDSGANDKISTANAYSKFGLSQKAIMNNIRNISPKDKFVNIIGLSMHIGSQVQHKSKLNHAYKKTYKLAKELSSMGYNINTLNLGGGFPVIYEKHDIKKIITPSEIAAIIGSATKGFNGKIIIEPGRSIHANSGILLSRVTRIKDDSGHHFVILDAGMNDLIRPCLYNSIHHILPLRQKSQDSVKIKQTIAGPICESSDIFIFNYKAQMFKKDEFVAIMQTGAYGRSMSSQYNSKPLTKEIII